jgi:hypothetical protein
MLKVRLAMAALFVILGLIIVARGVLQAAPLSFDLLGVLMILLGLVRLRDLRVMSDE